MTRYVIAADGACSGNPGPGGWAFVLFAGVAAEGNELKSGKGLSPTTTNNIMELTACREALDALSGQIPGEVQLRFDSEYCLKGIFEWLDGWKARGWKSASKKPVANREIWEAIDGLLIDLRSQGFTFTPDWVKGHAGDWANELVDTMAQEMRDEAKDGFNRAEDVQVEAQIADADLVAVPIVKSAADLPMAQPSLDMQIAQQRLEADAVHPGQVDLMRSILDLYASGDYSVKKVIAEIRANAVALGVSK